MDTETRAVLEKLAETVNTEGWKILTEDLEKKIAAIKDELTSLTTDGDMLRIAQGRVLAYKDLISLPITIQGAFNDAAEVDDDSV